MSSMTQAMSRLTLCQPFGVSYLLLFSSPFVFNPVCVSRSLPLKMFLLDVLLHFCGWGCSAVCHVCSLCRSALNVAGWLNNASCASLCIQILRGTEQMWTLWCSPQVSTPSVRKVSHSEFAEMSQWGRGSHAADQDDIITVQCCCCCCSRNHQREF